jgi:hypothetical protein
MNMSDQRQYDDCCPPPPPPAGARRWAGIDREQAQKSIFSLDGALTSGLPLSSAKERASLLLAFVPSTRIPPSARSCSPFSLAESAQLVATLAENAGFF